MRVFFGGDRESGAVSTPGSGSAGRLLARRGVLAVALALTVLGGAGCAGDESSGSAGVGISVGEPVSDKDTPASSSSGDLGSSSGNGDSEETTIASGESGGVGWRLFVLPLAGLGDLLCLEVGGPPPETCVGGFQYGSATSGMERVAVLEAPTVSDGEPAFVFGSIGKEVARVVVELGSGERIAADVVGKDRALYIVALPADSSPVEVVAYASNGRELARQGFDEDEPEVQRTEDYEQSCEQTERGSTCKGSATISGSGSGGSTGEPASGSR